MLFACNNRQLRLVQTFAVVIGGKHVCLAIGDVTDI